MDADPGISQAAKRRTSQYVSWTFADDYPMVGGKAITVKRPTAAQEYEVRAAQDASMYGLAMEIAQNKDSERSAMSVKIDVAKQCIVAFDGLDLVDSARDGVWDDDMDGWARDDCLAWVDHNMTPTSLKDEDGKDKERRRPFLG